MCAKASADCGGEPVQIANYLCNGNYAVSGSIPAIDKVAEIAKPEFKARMVVKLAVAGAFHTDFMAPAAEALTAGLKDTPNLSAEDPGHLQRQRRGAHRRGLHPRHPREAGEFIFMRV